MSANAIGETVSQAGIEVAGQAVGLAREFHFTDDHFEVIRRLVGEHAGIRLTEAKKDMVYSRLARRLRQLGIRDFGTYCGLVEDPHDGPGELSELINAITTNLTAFFRESHHFRFLSETALPQLMKQRADRRRLRIWSAGCSTGEEAYSLAMVIKEVLPPQWDAKILATDLDSNVLQTGREGVYGADRVKDIPLARLSRWFLRGKGVHEGLYKVKPELREVVVFRQLNLLNGWPFHGPFDIVFCRNVVIYFSKETQRVLFERMANILSPDGYLFIGHSESLFKISERFRLIGNTIYQREMR